MAGRKPLVIVNGEVQNLQPGDYLSVPISGVSEVSQTNDEAGPIVIGTPVYNDANDGVKKAKADASGTSKVLGLVSDTSITNAVAGNIAIAGVLVATVGQWDAVAGTTGGLTAGTYYYLSAGTAGLLTATSPSVQGQYRVLVGMALSTTEMLLILEPRILL